MMKSLFRFLVLFLALAAPSAWCADAPVPEWLAELSNLPRNDREEYVKLFTQAKQDLAAGNWVACDTDLTGCEMIFPKNPNVWNMRCTCYTEQKRFDEAAAELEKARKVLPRDPSTLVNIATLHMARKEYKECIDELSGIIEQVRFTVPEAVVDILTFRIFLCYLMLGQEDAAVNLVEDYGPLADSPIFYYSRAAICIYKKDLNGAREDMASADRIFANNGATVPYQRALIVCGMVDAQ